MSENVCITSLSEGRWFNTNIWETRGSYFEIDGKDYSIKCSVDPKDPKITGKTVKRLISKVPEKVPLKKSAGNGGTKKERDELVEDTVSLDDKIRTVVSPITVPRELLSTDENFIFNEILRENNCCVPFAILRGIQHNPKAREHIYRIFFEGTRGYVQGKIKNGKYSTYSYTTSEFFDSLSWRNGRVHMV